MEVFHTGTGSPICLITSMITDRTRGRLLDQLIITFTKLVMLKPFFKKNKLIRQLLPAVKKKKEKKKKSHSRVGVTPCCILSNYSKA